MTNYWILRNDKDDAGAVIDAIPDSGVSDWKYAKGIPLLNEFNEGVKIFYSDNFPSSTKLYDFITNILGVLIVSDKVKAILEDEGVEEIEYLPVMVCDHKENIVDDKYWIINLIGGQDIIDMENSKYKMGNIDKTQIKRIKNLIVNPQGVKESRKFFRANNKMNLFFITDSIKEAFEKNNISGFKLFAADGWDGFDI